MKVEARPDGSLVVRSTRSLPLALAALGVAIAVAVAAQEARDAARVALGLLGCALALAVAAAIDRSEFEFDALERRVRWRRRNLFRARAGELGFDEIRSVALRVRATTDEETRHRIVQRYHRVVLETARGELPLSNVWSGDDAAQARIADAIRAALAR